MRDEQDFYVGQCDGADERKLSEVVVNLEAVPGRDTRLREALARVAEGERAPIVVALARWIKRRAGLDDAFYPTLRQLRTQARCLELAAAADKLCGDVHGRAPTSYAQDAAALRVLLGALTGGLYTDADLSVLDDKGLDGGLDDDGLDDDTDDDGLDDDHDEHGADCFCDACCEAQLVGLATVAGDDPDAYLARSGAGDLATVGREVLDDDGLDEDGLDFNPCPRPPDCDWCGGKGCDTCSDPNYAGVDP